jgi:hypothetical protein
MTPSLDGAAAGALLPTVPAPLGRLPLHHGEWLYDHTAHVVFYLYAWRSPRGRSIPATVTVHGARS